MVNTIQLIPDAHLLLSSLRSVGYKVETAISDIIDNCIGAHATEIHIDFNWNIDNPTNSSILIYDNGDGMNENKLIASMKIGSADPSDTRDIDDLGRFGMGMKTAAFSLGKKLTVQTKQSDNVSSACWDLNYIESQKDGVWSLLVGDSVISEDHNKLTSFETGTIIKIESLDRLIDETSLKKSKVNFYKIADKVAKHIGLIFHRFIEEDSLEIYFGSDLIKPWNPFIISNSATQELSEEVYFDTNGRNPVSIQPYVLPHKTKFSSEAELNEAQGYKGWNAHQGVYVYRNRRLLIYGTWFDYIKKEPAYNLARIKLDITSDYDYDWKIDIKKSVAIPPLYIRDMLERAIDECTVASSKVYNSRGVYSKSNSSEQLDYVWEQRKNRSGNYVFFLNKKHPLINEIMKQLSDEQRDSMKAYLALVEGYAPFVYSGLTSYLSSNNSKEKETNGKLTDIAEAKKLIRKFMDIGFEKSEVESTILGMPNYRHIEPEIKQIFEEENYD